MFYIQLLSILTVSVCSYGNKVTNSCPVWFNYDNNKSMCLCSPGIEGYISCCQTEQYSLLHLGKAIGERNGSALVAHIPYIYPQHLVGNNMLIKLNWNISEELHHLCSQLNRESTSQHNYYCSHCKKHYGPAIYSFGIQCAKCYRFTGLIKYIFLQIFPISIFYGAVLIFKIDLTRPNMLHYVIFCNVVTVMFRYCGGLVMSYLYSHSILPVVMKISLTMSGVWALDFLRFVVPPFCFSEKLHDCVIPFFDFFPALYLLILTLTILILIKLHNYRIRVVLWLWRPFKKLFLLLKLNHNPIEAVAHTYATFFLLYFPKTVAMAILTALTSPAFTQNATENVDRLTVFYDPSRKYFDPRHITIVMTVFITAAVLIFPAVFLVILFRTSSFQRFYHAKIGHQFQVILRVFTQTFENGYKDGSRGTKDYRPMTGILFLCLILLCGAVVLLCRVSQYTENIPWPFAGVGFITLAVTYGILRPYTKRSSNNVAITIYGILTMIIIIISFIQQRNEGFYVNQRTTLLGMVILLILAVNVAYTIYITYKIVTYFAIDKYFFKLIRKNCWCCRCPCTDDIIHDEDQSLIVTPPPTYYQ